MTTRQIFKDLKLFKKEVTERFLIVTRSIYENHPVYKYKDEEKDSGILIYPSYANPERDGKLPRIIAKPGSYSYQLLDTMYNNMSRELIYNGAVAGYEHSQTISIPMTLLVHAYAEEESSDIADEFVSLAVFACRKMYSGAGLIVRGAQVSETDLFNREQSIYQTTVSLSLETPWVTSMVNTTPPIKDIVLSPEEEDPLYFETYRPPGVSVVQEKSKD